jgi:predicted dehydrogenase
LPSLEKVKSFIDSGRIGKIARANFQAGQWLPDWRPGRDYKSGYSANADQGGGVALDLVHEIDAVRWMLGDFESVQATSLNTNILGIRSNDVAGALLSRRAGPLVFVGLDYIARKAHREYRFIGDKGTLTWNLQDRKITLDSVKGSEIVETDPDMFDIGATYLSAMRELISASTTGQTRYPLDEALRTTDLMLRIHGPQPFKT